MNAWVCALLAGGVLSLALFPTVSAADETAPSAQTCGQIENARERLACFDQLFPPAEGRRDIPKIRVETIRPPEALGQPSQSSSAPLTSPSYSGTPSGAPGTSGRQRGILDRDEEVDLTAVIDGLRRGEQQKMVFRLDNDQIWMQASPRDLPYQEGDTVTIKNGRLGGYIMRSEGGTSTRVRRIQ